MKSKLPYRKGVNVVIFNVHSKKFLLVQLKEYKSNEWKFVGGGVESGEIPINAAYREIEEEVGLKKSSLRLLGKSSFVQKYTFPDNIKSDVKKIFKGQEKIQFVFLFVGNEKDLVLQKDEIRKARWIEFQELSKYMTFPDQFENAKKLVKEFDLLV